ncbi:Uncharacterised protein [Neisseria animaloris]|uniref:Uncharacterized protein n=1 Tax=Neisseria animaloris TaxID=326522 RepID=A0A1X3CHT8_9NEIS|nr:hypothetical protein [Neisseria animaloris]MDO5073037.1 hypothetical protein [Neisseria animaloris]OSI07210.1 hypothetical protein BWD08_08695 [Neisseria animaloris]VEH86424.1 Uncharacterised protein [Neisseria animaloris]VEJ21390.1 Uncharacterised protein [Neisseria animaloris]
MSRRSEERELLELKANLARLKITAEQLKLRKARAQQKHIDSKFNQFVSLADGLPSSDLLWKSAFLPLRWKHRFMLGAGLVLWRLWNTEGRKRR